MSKPASLYDHQVIDGNSNVVPGAQVTFMQGRTKPVIYNDPALKIPARNPHPTRSDGYVTVYLEPGQYEVEIVHPNGRRRQFTHWAVANVNLANIAEPEIVTIETVRDVPVEVTRDNPDTLAELIELREKINALRRPPAAISELFVPSETYEQANERLARLFGQAKGYEEYYRSHGNMGEAMKWLKKAEHLESGIKWNRGRMAETI